MAAANSLNISQQGVVYFNGIAQFLGLDGGTAGNVLTSNGTLSPPSFQALNPQVVIKSAMVNMKILGNTTIFVPTGNFIFTGITTYGATLVGSITAPVVNFGWTAANYDDLVNGYTAFVTVQGTYINNMTIAGSGVPFLPSGTPFVMRVVSEDSTATTDIQRIDVLGYYF